MRTHLERLVERGHTPGLQFVAAHADGRLTGCAVGWADLRQRRAMTLDTTLMAYSMTKTLTAMVVLQLVDRGLLDVDAPVADFVSGFPYGGQVTVRHLLAHTGGLPNPIPLRWVHKVDAHHAFDETAALQSVLDAHPRRRAVPGNAYAYSNVGYWLLGVVIEKVSGQTFAAAMTDALLVPLGLGPADAGFVIAEPDRHATGYLERWSVANLLGRWLFDRTLLGSYDGRWRRIAPHYPNGPAFGGLVATATAFGRLLLDQLQPRSTVLGDTGRALLYEVQRTNRGAPVPMTLGWHVKSTDGGAMYFKEGGGGGFHCMMRLYPHRGLGTAVMTNATGFDVAGCLDVVCA